MTQNKSTLFINRVVIVTHSGSIAYDEKFHEGVNIIRGQNSSGKSTIANFIFYGLGGSYNNWTTEAMKCREVLIEIKLSGAVITIKRYISTTPLQSMNIFWGAYEDSKQDAINWQTYPYKQSISTNTISFSNVIFNALSFPEVKSDLESNITLHQILRLLYIDQDTPTQNLFRFERFDLPLTRQTISELLLGIYDDDLYDLRLSLKDTQKKSDEKKRQFDSINKVIGESGNLTDTKSLNNSLEAEKNKLAYIDNEIQNLKKQTSINTTKRTPMEFEKVQLDLIPTKNKIKQLIAKANEYEIEIADSTLFISTLEKRITELKNSLLTRNILGELPLTHCPECLNELDTNTKEGHCSLCKQPISEEAERANAKRLMQEMELQVRESKSLLKDKEIELNNINNELSVELVKGKSLQKKLDTLTSSSQSTRDDRIDSMLVTKGNIERNIDYLSQQFKTIKLIESLKNELLELSTLIKTIESEIFNKEEQQKNKYNLAQNKINEITLYILKNDLKRQAEFHSGKNIEVDFLKDSFSLDGSNNFSASSKTLFKNAVLFAIFFASLELDFFRYPRFILCDNMEDKGMEKERAQNFQKLITQVSESIGTMHQIIFTTSMIADELNDTEYCVGQYYTTENKTLKV